MQIDPAGLEGPDLYRMMISAVVPRPIAWVSTVDAEGVVNAAPFSYFQALASDPPSILVSVGKRRSGDAKDTRANIDATKEFVVNVVSEPLAAAMVRTSVDHPPDVSELEQIGLEPAPSVKVRPPRIAASPVSLECRLAQAFDIGRSRIFVGEILLFHVRDDVLGEDGNVDPWKLRPVGRLGGSHYAPLREVLSIDRDGNATVAHGEFLDFWRDLRSRTIAIARRLDSHHLQVRVGEDGDTVGRILRHIAGCTAYYRLRLAGRESEDEHRHWDPTWTPERLVEELEQDRAEFEAAARAATPEARDLLRLAVRHEAWHQGQIAGALRGEFRPDELWGVGPEA